MQVFAYTTAITELIEIKIIHAESPLTLLTFGRNSHRTDIIR
jgi:hypothetical protein